MIYWKKSTAACLLSLALSACGAGKAQLVGSWVNPSANACKGGTVAMNFHNDGTVEMDTRQINTMASFIISNKQCPDGGFYEKEHRVATYRVGDGSFTIVANGLDVFTLYYKIDGSTLTIDSSSAFNHAPETLTRGTDIGVASVPITSAPPVATATSAPAQAGATVAQSVNAAPQAAAPVPSKQQNDRASTVREFYRQWDAKNFTSAYRLLSSRYQGAHPFASWEQSHESVVNIAVDATDVPNSTAVAVRIQSTDRVGSGTVHNSYAGTWFLVREGASWRLDVPQIQ